MNHSYSILVEIVSDMNNVTCLKDKKVVFWAELCLNDNFGTPSLNNDKIKKWISSSSI